MSEANYFHLESVIYDTNRIINRRGLAVGQRVQQYIDSECLRLMQPMVPKAEGNLIQSGIINTNIGSGQIKYETPYARRWYYMPANFQEAPQRGNYWFERMKQQYMQNILEGAKKRAQE